MEKLNRAQIVTLSNAAYQLNRYADAKKIIIAWLKKYPNDLWIRYRLAIILYKMGEYDDAIRLCELMVSEDPEFSEVWGLLAVLYPKDSNDRKLAEYRVKKVQTQDFSIKKGVKKIFQKNVQNDTTETVMENDEFDILSSIINAKSLLIDDNYLSSCRIITIYNRRWPKVIQFKLILGHILNQMGRDADGMAVIQSAVNSDLTDQVGKRIWADCNPYRKLWPDLNLLMIDIDGLKLPFNVVKLAGLENFNDLIEQKPINDIVTEFQDDDLEDNVSSEIDTALNTDIDSEKMQEAASLTIHEEKISLEDMLNTSKRGNRLSFWKEGKNSRLENSPITEYVYRIKSEDAESGSPVYVILTTVSGLIRKYGANNKDFINQEMHSVADAVSNRNGWETQVFYPDEFVSVGSSGMSAEAVHQALVKFDASLREKNKMIGALLIVGGDDVVPFFRLKNPTSDNDTEVLSDAPYGVLDSSNCYEMQWQVGRLPGDSSDDPGFLLQQLRNVQNHHIMRYTGQKKAEKSNNKSVPKKIGKCFGYSCAAWVTPSSIVYKTIADTSSLLLCPATTSSNFPVSVFSGCDLGYFNLHGIKGHPNWYGKKKLDDDSNTPNTPVALEIKNVESTNETPKVVYSECCYGAETPNRNEKNCMSLHFLGKATRVFVGSTSIAYGALNADLTAADLLGYLFWKHLSSGISCGEAFRRAKKNLATETEQKYGGLDSELQKTLLSFVFYGDPLYTLDDSADINNLMQRCKNCRVYELLGEESNYGEALDPEMSSDIYREIKNEYRINSPADDYSQYMVKKQVNYNRTGKYALHSLSDHSNYVITYVKNMRVGNMTDRSVVRVTVRDDGVIQKVSFSR